LQGSSYVAGLRFHDLRHHAITELAESQTSDQTIMAIAGHVSPKMLQHYSHVRLAAKRAALDSLANSPLKDNSSEHGTPQKSGSQDRNCDTSYDTRVDIREEQSLEVTENDGRPEWIRTIDLFRVKEAL